MQSNPLCQISSIPSMPFLLNNKVKDKSCCKRKSLQILEVKAKKCGFKKTKQLNNC